jgi:hypothetical protein
MTTLISAERIFDALNGGQDGIGLALTQDARARIYRAIDEPGHATWTEARSILVTPFATLWKMVEEASKPQITLEADDTPTSYMILAALEFAARENGNGVAA